MSSFLLMAFVLLYQQGTTTFQPSGQHLRTVEKSHIPSGLCGTETSSSMRMNPCHMDMAFRTKVPDIRSVA